MGSRGTVGTPKPEHQHQCVNITNVKNDNSQNTPDISPVWSSLGIWGGAELSDRPDKLSSSPVGLGGTTGGGVTADS